MKQSLAVIVGLVVGVDAARKRAREHEHDERARKHPHAYTVGT